MLAVMQECTRLVMRVRPMVNISEVAACLTVLHLPLKKANSRPSCVQPDHPPGSTYRVTLADQELCIIHSLGMIP